MQSYLRKELMNLYNVTEQDFINWCKTNNMSKSYKDSVITFIYKLRTGRLVKDNSGNLIKKRVTKKRKEEIK